MSYTRKTQNVYIIQQDWGQGWEDVMQEDTHPEARARLKEYRENQPQAPARLITRREKVDSLFIGVYPTGIIYADRTHKNGDYKRLGFLSFSTLNLSINAECSPELRTRIKEDARKIQARRGQKYYIDTSENFVILGG